MKTHILQLEPYDDLISACDKMEWGKADRLLLVWPAKGRILQRRLDLTVIQRQSNAQGAQLALVCRDPIVRYYALRLGIPVFASVRKAQARPWRVPHRFRARHRSPEEDPLLEIPNRTLVPASERLHDLRQARNSDSLNATQRIMIFSLGVFACLSLLIALFPSAEIQLQPKTQNQDISVILYPDFDASKATRSGSIPAQRVTVIVEARDAIPASGEMLFPDRYATGFATFTNLTGSTVTVPTGTVVQSSDQQRFTITSSGSIPGGVGKSISLPLRSLAPGSQANVPAGALVAIEGILGAQASVSNLQPLRNGTNTRLPAPTPLDRQKLKSRLYQSLETSAVAEIEKHQAQGAYVIPGSLELKQVITENYHPAEPIPANLLSLSLQLEYQAWILSAEDILAKLTLALETTLPNGYIPVPNSLDILSITAVEAGSDGSLPVKVSARRSIQIALSDQDIIQRAFGLSVEQAKLRLLEDLPLVTPPIILLKPSWWPRLPLLPSRITIHYLD